MKRQLLLGMLLLTTSFVSAQTGIIRGRVLAKPDMRDLASASVFISNTTLGAVCDADGYFEFLNLKSGSYRLVISFVGYETKILEVLVSESKLYTVALAPQATVLPHVVITGRRAKRQRQSFGDLKTFRDYFIGMSDNARECTVLNEHVLRFKKTAGVLHAFADSALIIVNRGLGYKISFLLEEFEFNRALRTVDYRGQTIFERIVPSDSSEERKFARNRLKAYAGSQLHFMRSLFEGATDREGFYMVVKYQRDGVITKDEVAYSDTVVNVKSPLFKQDLRLATLANPNQILNETRSRPERLFLSFNGLLEVTYVNEAEPLEYLRFRGQKNAGYTVPQRSILTLRKDGVSIEPTGMVLEEENLVAHGYWVWELVAESLPVDYEPGEDVEVVK